MLLLTLLLLLASCTSTIMRRYEPVGDRENKIIYRNNSKASKIIQDDIQTIIQFKEKIDDTIYISAEVTNNSQEELLITPNFFRLYSENKIVHHFSYEEDLERRKSYIKIQRDSLKTNSLQDALELTNITLSLFKEGEEYKEYEENRIQNEKLEREKKSELNTSINEFEELLKNYPIRHTLLKNERKQFILKFRLKAFPNQLHLKVGSNENTPVTFQIR